MSSLIQNSKEKRLEIFWSRVSERLKVKIDSVEKLKEHFTKPELYKWVIIYKSNFILRWK